MRCAQLRAARMIAKKRRGRPDGRRDRETERQRDRETERQRDYPHFMDLHVPSILSAFCGYIRISWILWIYPHFMDIMRCAKLWAARMIAKKRRRRPHGRRGRETERQRNIYTGEKIGSIWRFRFSYLRKVFLLITQDAVDNIHISIICCNTVKRPFSLYYNIFCYSISKSL